MISSAGHPRVSVKTVGDLVALARRHKGKLNAGSNGAARGAISGSRWPDRRGHSFRIALCPRHPCPRTQKSARQEVLARKGRPHSRISSVGHRSDLSSAKSRSAAGGPSVPASVERGSVGPRPIARASPEPKAICTSATRIDLPQRARSGFAGGATCGSRSKPRE